MPDGLRKFDGELLFGELRDDPVYIADDAVHALGVVAEHVGELRKVLQRAFQVVFLGGKYLRHVARHGVEVAERPGDIAGVVLHQPVEVVERTRQIAGELRDFLLEEIQLRTGHVHQVAVAARPQRIPLVQVGVGPAVGYFDRLGAHQPVAENLGFRIGRNAVLALDGEPQHDFVAAGGVERQARHRTDLDALHHDRRSVLHAVDLVVSRIIFDIAAENIESFQKADARPCDADHRHGENSDLNFPFHTSYVFISRSEFPGSSPQRRRGRPCAPPPVVSAPQRGSRIRRRNTYNGICRRPYIVSPCRGSS